MILTASLSKTLLVSFFIDYTLKTPIVFAMAMVYRLNKIATMLGAALMLLSGCSNSFVQPNGFVYKGLFQKTNNTAVVNQQRSRLQPQINPTRTSPERGFAAEIKVRRGDTLYSLSKLANVPINELISANALQAPYQLKAGQTINVPFARTHKVQRGDTLSSLATQYGVSLNTLAKVNNLSQPFRISVNDELLIPGRYLANKQVSSIQSTSARQRTVVRSTPAQQKQTQQLRRNSSSRVAIPARQSGKFLWPVRGKVISNFGVKGGGIQNDGIDIAAREGDDVRAAEAGVVAYVDNNFGLWGQLILIKHADNWVSTYAHSSRILVNIGDRVTRGQVIAKAGSTGAANQSKVHFELRRNKRIVNPTQYLE